MKARIPSFICMKAVLFFTVSLAFCAVTGCNKHIYNSTTIKQLPKNEYFALMDSLVEPYILDIRTGLEYKRGHVEGARNISFLSSEFGWHIADLDTSRPVFLYCETAHRSPFATKQLKKAGFTQIYDLEGGYSTLRAK